MGNHGLIVLIPTDERTAALLRRGATRLYQRLLEEAGVASPADEAEKLAVLLDARSPWSVFRISSSSSIDSRMYEESWKSVLRSHRTAGSVFQHFQGECCREEEDYE